MTLIDGTQGPRGTGPASISPTPWRASSCLGTAKPAGGQLFWGKVPLTLVESVFESVNSLSQFVSCAFYGQPHKVGEPKWRDNEDGPKVTRSLTCARRLQGLAYPPRERVAHQLHSLQSTGLVCCANLIIRAVDVADQHICTPDTVTSQ